MGDEQVGAPGASLLDDRERRVEGEEDPSHGLSRVARDQTHPVPVGSAVLRVEPVEDGEDVPQRQVTHVGPAGLEPTTPAV